jgi:hypothetical protein
VFAVIIPVGPDKQELVRLQNSVEALEFYEPGRYLVVLVDDVLQPRKLVEFLPARVRKRAVVIQNPRRGQGNGWAAGLATALSAGIVEALRLERNLDFVLKYDTDALVIAPFADRLKAAMGPTAGILGTRRIETNPTELEQNIKPLFLALKKLGKPLTVWRTTPLGRPLLQACIFGRAKKRYQIIRRAMQAGYLPQHHINGGAFALSPQCLKRLNEERILVDPLLWLETPLPDDITFSMIVRAIGLDLVDLSRPGQIFAIQWRGLMQSPQRLLDGGYGIIHSVKDRDGLTESETRRFFDDVRRTQASVSR